MALPTPDGAVLVAEPPAAAERLTGVIERVTFHSEESGFCVLRVKLVRRREPVTLVGRAARVAPGEYVDAEGSWSHDREHGLQFRARELRVTEPTNRDGVERFLASGLIRGIGPTLAERLVARFGMDVFDVIERAPERLAEVRGVGAVRRERIEAGWAEQKRVREIMLFLHSHGVGTSRAVRIYRTYGDAALERIREDPYRLARDIRGIGFKTADALASELGVEPDAPIRVRAGLHFVLAEALSEGHCGLPRDLLGRRAERLLGVPSAPVDEALEVELASGALVADVARERDCVFLAGLHAAEREVARRLAELSRGGPPWPEIEAARAIPWVERRLGLELARGQRGAIETALRSKLVILTGGPGVGKTTLVNSLLTILDAKGVRTDLAAPTGRAARRLAEASGHEARTLHRLLEVDPRSGRFLRDERRPLECDLVVVDETSMVDVLLLRALLRAVPPRAALLLIGDVDQLPSVGPGRVLGDAIESGALPVVRLSEVFRQAARSRIVENAHRIRRGRMPDLEPREGSDFFFVDAEEPDEAAERLLHIVCQRIPGRFGLDPVREVQVLCPMYRGAAGAHALNAALQARLNLRSRAGTRVDRFGSSYAVGDKVMQLENDYERDVYNGDIGFVRAVDPAERELHIAFDDRRVAYRFEELDALALAYATTIHKAQGSEYPAVVIPLLTSHYPMLRRSLLYTAVTRARGLVVLVGQRRALAIALRTGARVERWTKLSDWLVQLAVAPPLP
jgi:exodeoxyribonuclease V alpha subunit